MTNACIISAAIAVTVIYTILVHTCGRKAGANSVVWNWWHRLISTTVSVVLGVVVGLHMFHYQNQQRRNAERGRCIQIVAAEMSDIYRVLQDSKSMTVNFPAKTYATLVTYVQPIAIEDAARSGLFSAIQTENLLHLARKVRLFNRETEFLLALLSQNAAINPDYQERIEFATRNMDTTRKGILESVDHCKVQLGFALSDSIKK